LAAAAAGIAPDLSAIRPKWMQKVKDVLQEATLQLPADGWMQKGGKDGVHTELLGFLLAEMQYLQRAYPGNKW
jgi:ring-1,2-phenylacetyl-CoA epoxidase subunit PaaC